jgi:MFS family permease
MAFSVPAVLRDRNFLIYTLGNAVSWLGTWAQRIGVGWLSWALTHETFSVGLISLAQILPMIAFGPLFGALLDRHDHRYYAIAVNVILALLAVALYVLTASHLMTFGVLLMLALLLGVVNSAYQAVRLAMINDVVPQHLLPGAITTNSVVYNVARAVGPAIAGVIIARYGIAAAFAVNAVSFVGVLGALVVVRIRPLAAKESIQGLFAESREGLRYVMGHPGIRQMMLLSAITSILARGVLELYPAFADSVFHRGSVGLADLTTAGGLGAIVGALLLSRAGSTDLLPRLTRYAALWLGALVIVFGLTSAFEVGLVLSAVLGFAIVLCSVGLQVMLQSSIRDGFRGRVLGLWTAVNVAGPGVGGALIGAFAQWVGLRAVTVTAGILCVLLVIWAMPRASPITAVRST